MKIVMKYKWKFDHDGVLEDVRGVRGEHGVSLTETFEFEEQAIVDLYEFLRTTKPWYEGEFSNSLLGDYILVKIPVYIGD